MPRRARWADGPCGCDDADADGEEEEVLLVWNAADADEEAHILLVRD